MQQGDAEFREQNPLTEAVIGACIEVHRHLGPGLLESAYEHCLCRELRMRGLPFERQLPLPLTYKGETLDCGYRADIVVCGEVLVELKSVEHLEPIHVAQVLTYLRIASVPIGLLINFNVPALKHGIRRLILKNPPWSPRLPVNQVR